MALDYGYTIRIQQNGKLDPNHTLQKNQWQRKLSGSSSFSDISGASSNTYVVDKNDRNAKLRLAQTFSNDQILYSNELQVTNAAPADPWDNYTGAIYHLVKSVSSNYINVYGSDVVYKLDGTEVPATGYSIYARGNYWRLSAVGEYLACGMGTRMEDSTSAFSLGEKTDTHKVTNMTLLFCDTPFNASITRLDTSNVRNMSEMFRGASDFNQTVAGLATFEVENMAQMFSYASSFNQRVDNFDTSKVRNLSGMFYQCSTFNQRVDGLVTGAATDISLMFESTPVFNQPVSTWRVNNVVTFEQTFSRSAFNQSLSGWNTAKAKSMKSMFDQNKAFNQATVSNFNTGNVTNFGYMFSDNPIFNVDLGGWDVSNATFMDGMFKFNDIFNRDLSEWCVPKILSEPPYFNDRGTLTPSSHPCWGECGCPDVQQGFSTIGNFGSDGNKWWGATIGQDGMIYAAPSHQRQILRINPSNDSASMVGSQLATTSFKFSGMYRQEGSNDLYLVSAQSSYHYKYNSQTGSLSSLPGSINTSQGTRHMGGSPTKSGKIVGVAAGSTAGTTFAIIDTAASTWSSSSQPSGVTPGYAGAVYGNDSGNGLVLVPHHATQAAIYDISKGSLQRLRTLGSVSGNVNGSKWAGGAMAPNGIVYCAPHSAKTILAIDAKAGTRREITSTAFSTGTSKWWGAVLAHNGKIYFIPARHGYVMEFDPATETAQPWGDDLGSTSTNKYRGGVLAPNGKIYCIPSYAESVLVIDLGLGPVNGKTWTVSGLPNNKLDPLSPLFNKV